MAVFEDCAMKGLITDFLSQFFQLPQVVEIDRSRVPDDLLGFLPFCSLLYLHQNISTNIILITKYMSYLIFSLFIYAAIIQYCDKFEFLIIGYLLIIMHSRIVTIFVQSLYIYLYICYVYIYIYICFGCLTHQYSEGTLDLQSGINPNSAWVPNRKPGTKLSLATCKSNALPCYMSPYF